MWVLLVAFLAGLINAFMDTIEEGKFGNSIFSKLDPKFWYKWQSWKYAKKIFNYTVDAWHLAKSGWWTCFSIIGVVYKATGPIFPHWTLDFIAIGLTAMLTFNTFYNKIFKRKP